MSQYIADEIDIVCDRDSWNVFSFLCKIIDRCENHNDPFNMADKGIENLESIFKISLFSFYNQSFAQDKGSDNRTYYLYLGDGMIVSMVSEEKVKAYDGKGSSITKPLNSVGDMKPNGIKFKNGVHSQDCSNICPLRTLLQTRILQSDMVNRYDSLESIDLPELSEKQDGTVQCKNPNNWIQNRIKEDKNYIRLLGGYGICEKIELSCFEAPTPKTDSHKIHELFSPNWTENCVINTDCIKHYPKTYDDEGPNGSEAIFNSICCLLLQNETDFKTCGINCQITGANFTHEIDVLMYNPNEDRFLVIETTGENTTGSERMHKKEQIRDKLKEYFSSQDYEFEYIYLTTNQHVNEGAYTLNIVSPNVDEIDEYEYEDYRNSSNIHPKVAKAEDYNKIDRLFNNLSEDLHRQLVNYII